MRLLVSAVFLLLVTPSPLQAQRNMPLGPCFEHKHLKAMMTSRGQVNVFRGMGTSREVILAWLNPQGAWAITVSPPDLGSCLFLSGQLGSVRLLPKPEVKQ
jgi:hypothetical protein